MRRSSRTSENPFDVTVNELELLMQHHHHHDAVQELQRKFGGIHGLEKKLRTNLRTGLTINQEDFLHRIEHFGRNRIPEESAKSFLRLMFKAMQDVTLIILIICAAISFALTFYPTDSHTKKKETNVEWIESVAIIIAVFVVTFVTAFNDWSKEKQFRGLKKKIEHEQKFHVIRNHQSEQIHFDEILVGDICQIKYGDLIPADGLVIQANDLKIDESSLTGESDLIKKNIYRNPFLLSGTHVMEGSGKMLVIAVGEHSQAGLIAKLLRSSKEKENETGERIEPVITGKDENKDKGRSILQSKLTKLAIQIGYIGMTVAILTVVVLIVRFSWEEFVIRREPWKAKYWNRFIRFFITGITVLVVAIPEGLPLAVTVSLAYAVKQMMYDNNLVRHLDACETMGHATTICSDKTGTLTTNRMTVVEMYIADQHWKNVNENNRLKDIPLSEKTKELLCEGISVNSSYTSKLIPPGENEVLPKQVGNKTECGLLSLVQDFGGSYEQIRHVYPEENFLHVYTFNSIRKSMSTIIERPDRIRLHAKGASEILLKQCTTIIDANGEKKTLSKDQVDQILQNVIEPMANDGLRTICIGYKDFAQIPSNWDDEKEIFGDLTCICICGIEDPVRPEVREAISQCREAGITVRMITGDNVNTARSIALKCGIISPTDRFLVLDGKEFNRRIRRNPHDDVDQELFDRLVPHLRVLARSSPQDKYVLVKHLVESRSSLTRQIVAVTGDGTNDGPALKKADVGFSMGIQGTDVAKEASDIILIDDNFTSIVKAIMWGRNVTDSIGKFLQFQLTVNMVALVCAFVGACVVKESPLRAVQMLWVNLIMDTLASLALATDKPTKDLLKRQPLGRKYPLITRRMLKNILGHSIYQLAVILFLLFAGPRVFDMQDGQPNLDGYVPSEHFTMIFNTFVLMTLFNEINCRQIHGEINVFHRIFANKIFCLIWFGTFFMQILLVQYGSMVFSCVPLSLDLWMWALLFATGTLVWNQVVNLLPMPSILCFSRCCRRKNAEETVQGVSNKGFQNPPQDPSSNRSSMASPHQMHYDLDDIRGVRLLWLRNVQRIQIQLRVIHAFRHQIFIKNNRC